MFFHLSDYFTCVTHACVPVLFASVSTAEVSVLNAGHSVLETEVFVAQEGLSVLYLEEYTTQEGLSVLYLEEYITQEGRPVPETCAFVILTVQPVPCADDCVTRERDCGTHAGVAEKKPGIRGRQFESPALNYIRLVEHSLHDHIANCEVHCDAINIRGAITLDAADVIACLGSSLHQ